MTRFTDKSLILFASILFIWMVSGCATGTQGTSKLQGPTSPVAAQHPSRSMLIHESDIVPFANRVEWPDFPEGLAESVYQIQSGVNDDGVWVEGKGYFKGSLRSVYDDFVNWEIMGPTYMTKDISIHDLKPTPVLTTFIMHVKLKYVMTVEFDVGATIDAVYNENDRQIGWRYRSEKVNGTRFITKIDEQIIVKQVNDEWFSVECQSLNVATMNKEEETRQHFETLFAHWKGNIENREVNNE